MIAQFAERFGSGLKPRVFRAPGRVNLIGEHTDYNLGFVMPIALDMSCYMAIAPDAKGEFEIYSLDKGEGFSFDADPRRAKRQKKWTDYIMGVAQKLANAGVRLSPVRMMFHSSVPEGAGLSSSAALEVSTAFALLNGRSFELTKIAKLCQEAEIEFVGTPCGIMDQYISVYGRDERAVEIDCRILEHRFVELPSEAKIVAVNSMVKHDLATSAYADRTRECAAAVEAIGSRRKDVKSLRDAKLSDLETPGLTEVVKKRARHVITENARVESFRAASAKKDLAEMGKLFYESHKSMKDDYEITCEEIDFLVDKAAKIPGVFGARMTGGGFGGCTVNLIKPEAVENFKDQIRRSYQEKFHIDPPIFDCVPSKGAEEVKDLTKLPEMPALKKA